MSLDPSAWARATLGHWQGWLSGGGVGGAIALIIAAVERLCGRELPKKWYATILLGGFFVGANYAAWHDAYLSMKGRERDLHLKEGELATQQRTGANLQARLDALNGAIFIEPPNSLRRRARKLADDIDQFWSERNDLHPPRSNGRPDAVGEQAEINKESDAYDVETNRVCLARFGTKILGIPKEMNAKGLPTQWLHTFDANNNLRCLYGGNYPSSETQILRDLSYRLDAHDMPVEF